MVDKLKFGDRHTCFGCGCKFYDMHRNPPICPKCGTDVSQRPKQVEEAPAFVADVEEEDEEIVDEIDEKTLEVETDDDLMRNEDEGDEA